MTSKAKARKPRKLKTWSGATSGYVGDKLVVICARSMDAKDCRKLARFLTQAADYLESKEK
jgi:hypothetical protein